MAQSNADAVLVLWDAIASRRHSGVVYVDRCRSANWAFLIDIKSTRKCFSRLGLTAILALVPVGIAPVSAQNVVFDGSFSNQDLGNGPVYNILSEDGFISDNNQNIFYSFERFSLFDGEVANFDSGGTLNIFSRITGSDASSIAGRISADANFYLINPNGIVFNNAAELDVTGAFIASTSRGLFFNNGTIEFQAIDPQASSDALLIIAEDPGSFNQIERQGDIEVNGVTLAPSGLQLGFDADTVTLDDADLSVPNGLIGVEARNIFILNGSTLDTATSGTESAGVISLVADSQVLVDDSALFANSVNGSDGSAGLIFVEGKTLTFDSGSELQAQTTGSGQAGIIALRTSEQGTITFDDRSAAFSSIEENGFSLQIGVPEVFNSNLTNFFVSSELLDGFAEDFNTFNIVVDTGTLNLRGESTIQTVVRGANETGSSAGIAGWIGIAANDVNITNGSEQISSGIFSSVGEGASQESRAGAIILDVENLTLDNQAVISTSIASDGTPGLVAIVAEGDVVVRDDSLIASVTLETANASTLPDAFPGTVVLGANRLAVEDNSAVTVTNLGSGVAGDISIFADVVAVDSGSEISAETLVSGEGGNIELASEFLVLSGDSNVTTASGGSGGNITLDIQEVVYGTPSQDNNILAQGGTDGGNIEFSEALFLRNIAPRDEDFQDSNDITASGQFSEGTIDFLSGTQDINPVQEQVNLPTNLIDSSRLIAEGCAAGNLTAAQEIGELVVTGRGGLPPSSSEQVREAGILPDLIKLPDDRSTITPNNMGTPEAEPEAIVDGQTADSGPIFVEAQGWVYGADGEVLLTATAQTVTPRAAAWAVPVCGDVF